MDRLYFEDIDFTNNVFDQISIKLLKDTRLIPYNIDSKYVYVLRVLGDELVQDNIIKLIFNKKIKYSYISSEDFERVINYLSKSSIQGFYENILQKNPINSEVVSLQEDKEEFYNKEIKNSFVVRSIDNLIEKAILLRASDIHFEPKSTCVNIRFRIDGELIKQGEFTKEVYLMAASRMKILSSLDITKHLETQDGKFIYKYNNEDYDIRISILPTLFGERITLRILDDELNKYSFNDLYVDKKAKEEMLKTLEKDSGLILVVGATGSGKTTTLYSLLKQKINEKINIITVEDPVEYSISGVSQVQVDTSIGLSFTDALRTVLRQDPDVFMIGEIRDEESARIAIRSATTGHLVLSTLHANDSSTAISRLLDMGIQPFLVASSIKAVIYQKLIKKRCPKCSEEEYKNNLNYSCPFCNSTGFKGRLCVGEILIIDDELKKSIIENRFNEVIKEYVLTKKFIKISTIIKRAEKDKLIKINSGK